MSMPTPPGYQPPSQGASASDVVTQLQGVVRQLAAWVKAFTGRQTFGSFTLAVAATTTVNNVAAQANSAIQWSPTNAAAGTLEGSAKGLYLLSISPGISFTVKTSDGTNAGGTETFSYIITTPA